MATGDSSSKDENKDEAGRCLQQIRQWPKILELLGEEKVPAAQVCQHTHNVSKIPK